MIIKRYDPSVSETLNEKRECFKYLVTDSVAYLGFHKGGGGKLLLATSAHTKGGQT